MQNYTFSQKSSRGEAMAGPAGPFSNAHDFMLNMPNSLMIHGNVSLNAAPASDNFMEYFAKRTIPGAEFDSSERHPPPRCHPGTRKSIVDHIQFWLHDSCRTNRMLWLVGPAGVGKSAIMQTVAEGVSGKRILASLFFRAARDRRDPSKTGPSRQKEPWKIISTLAYRIAVQHPRYAAFLCAKVAADPKIFEKSMEAQFHAFIVIPFAKAKLYQGSDPIILLLDGLDEWEDAHEQQSLLGLVSHFSTSYPEAPLLWVVASRPEAHITSYLARRRLAPTFLKVEVLVGSTEACQDVERFLRSEFENIKGSHPVIMVLYPQWPQERDFLKLAAAASGLFAYAATVIRFVGDLIHGDPISRFQLVLDLIGGTSPSSATNQIQPMAHLDYLYHYILCQISPHDLPHAKLILSHLVWTGGIEDMRYLCNWVGIPPHVAYGALRNLHSVIQIPLPCTSSDDLVLEFYHKSFCDFLEDPRRSENFLGIATDLQYKLHALRVLNSIPHNKSGKLPLCDSLPHEHIPLFWPIGKSRAEATDKQENLYDWASFSVYTTGSLEHLPIPSIVHAIGVMGFWSYPFRGSDEYRIFELAFDMNSDLAKQLRENGILCEIPVELFGMDSIIQLDDDYLCIFTCKQIMAGVSRTSFLNPRDERDKWLSWKNRIVSILATPGVVVRALIGIQRDGWVEVKYPILSQENSDLKAEVAYFNYNFTDADGSSDSLEDDDLSELG
ncbi:hypothetical protein AN958_12341 [Leucoagaricus sp. SymC.cos]|nr:hypothetical protein AN958_12341 [Leucoagaricus sp. SymC.cos]